jgi:DNA invertase Pin-like site-specific DNA recombinase
MPIGGPFCVPIDRQQQETDKSIVCWSVDRFARSTRHLLAALEEFNHLGVRFISVQDQVDTDSPMGRAMFTIIGAMAELESSLISKPVTAGMRAAETRGQHLGRPAASRRIITEIETLATSTNLSIRQIQYCATIWVRKSDNQGEKL